MACHSPVPFCHRPREQTGVSALSSILAALRQSQCEQENQIEKDAIRVRPRRPSDGLYYKPIGKPNARMRPRSVPILA
jgi:hypothetical protein